jgi:hypothetical protein
MTEQQERQFYEAMKAAPIKGGSPTLCGNCRKQWWCAERAWVCLQSHPKNEDR